MSRTGASITFALLLFLVCAVIGSVVLVAGTAASGRFSKIAESDRRYYAVTSAACLIRDSLKDAKVTSTRTGTADYTETVSYKKNDSGYPQTASTRPAEIALGDPDIVGESAIIRSFIQDSSTVKEFELELSGTGNDYLDVDIKAEKKGSDIIEIAVSNSGEGEKFTLILSFVESVDKSSSSTVEELNVSITDFEGNVLAVSDDSLPDSYKKTVEKRETAVAVEQRSLTFTGIRKAES